MIIFRNEKEKEMLAQLELATKLISDGNTAYDGFSYEEGVKAVLEWLMIDDCPRPIEDDEVKDIYPEMFE